MSSPERVGVRVIGSWIRPAWAWSGRWVLPRRALGMGHGDCQSAAGRPAGTLAFNGSLLLVDELDLVHPRRRQTISVFAQMNQHLRHRLLHRLDRVPASQCLLLHELPQDSRLEGVCLGYTRLPSFVHWLALVCASMMPSWRSSPDESTVASFSGFA